jgi:hypothetical protein
MFVEPEAVPLLKVSVSTSLVFVPCAAINETSPVGCGDVGETETDTFTGAPCVTFTALPPFSVRVVEDAVNFTELQLLTMLLAFTEPSPVARS